MKRWISRKSQSSNATIEPQRREKIEELSAQDRALVQLGFILRDSGYRFTTVAPATHTRVNNRPGRYWAEDLRGVFGWSRPFHSGVVPSSMLKLMHEAGVLKPVLDGWRSTVRFSTLDEELFVHSAFPTLTDDAVFFGPDTYRFCDFIHEFLKERAVIVRRAADIGCGSGAGAILIAQMRREAEVLALDINPVALRLARINAALAATERVTVRHSNILDNSEGEFDLIIANPPYLVDAEERAYRHGGGALGAELSVAMMDAALSRLAVGGTLLLYTGVAMVDGDDPFLREVRLRAAATDLHTSYREIDPDVFGEEIGSGAYIDADRIAAVALRITRIKRVNE